MSEYSFTNIRSLVQDKDYIWISYGSTGKNFTISQQEVIDRILDNELDELEFMEISTDHPLEAFNIDSDNYVFSSVDGFLEFDPVSNSFIRLRSWGKDVENYAEKATNLSKDLKGNIWLGGSNILLNNYDGTYNLSKMNLEVLSGRTSSSDIYHDDNGRTWIVDERGVILIDGFDLGERGIHNIIFTKFVFPDSSIHYIYKTKTSEDSHDNFSLKHFRELSVHYTLPYQYSTRQVDFSYRMDDYNDQWSNWSTENYTLLSNLKAGKYTFRVKARFENGMETEPSSIGFTIEKFWYETLLFKALVIALTLLILIRIIRMMLKRRNRRELQMEEVITQRVNESFMFKLADRIGSENTGAGNPLDMLTQSGGSLTQPKELFFEKFVSLVEENMSDNELSVEKLAGMLNISQKMLYRRVKNATGLSARHLSEK
jgi:AraC-like DNA-binding protein